MLEQKTRRREADHVLDTPRSNTLSVRHATTIQSSSPRWRAIMLDMRLLLKIEHALLNLPFYRHVRSARNLLGQNLPKATVLALQAILPRRKSLEVAHQQLRFGKHDLVFSSRIGSKGDLILQLDIGHPRVSERFILEGDPRPNSSKLGNLPHEHPAMPLRSNHNVIGAVFAINGQLARAELHGSPGCSATCDRRHLRAMSPRRSG
jgi:hypothetical protein